MMNKLLNNYFYYISKNNMNTENYKITRELGKGTFGVTYLGLDNRTKRPVAIKTIDIEKSKLKGAATDNIYAEIDTLKILSNTDHPHKEYIVKYLESFEDTFNGASTIFIVSEYINGVSLYDYIKINSTYSLTPNLLWPLISQLLLGLQYIHFMGYAHRDIKPDNIMLTNDNNIKYIDFGLACLSECNKSKCVNTCRGTPGTPYYMPPEYVTGISLIDKIVTTQAKEVFSNILEVEPQKVSQKISKEDVILTKTTIGPSKRSVSSSRKSLSDSGTRIVTNDELDDNYSKKEIFVSSKNNQPTIISTRTNQSAMVTRQLSPTRNQQTRQPSPRRNQQTR